MFVLLQGSMQLCIIALTCPRPLRRFAAITLQFSDMI